MSPAGNRRRRRKRRIVGALGASALSALVILGTVINYWPGGAVLTPTGTLSVIRIDLLASRDADQTDPYGLPDNKPPASVQSWTQTGGDRCYPTSATTAACFEDSEPSYTVDATGVGWVVEPSATSRIQYSTDVDCTNWTCGGTADATPAQADPAGGSGASLIDVSDGSNYLYESAGGYTNNATLYLRFWLKCSAGDLKVRNLPGASKGDWRIDCATASGGAWVLIRSASQTGVTEVNPWVASATGGAGPVIGKQTAGTLIAHIWAFTIVEEAGVGLAVIPTAAAAVATGDIEWAIDNTSGSYYQAGDTVTQTITQYSGTCWVVSGSDLLLTGAAGSECAGIWYALQVGK